MRIMFNSIKLAGMKTCFCYNSKEETKNASEETGFDRIKRMYRQDSYGLHSPELYYVVQSATSTIMVSAVVGAVVNMMKVKDDYFRQNTASTYESQFLARRKLTDTMTLSGFKGAGKYAVKFGSFSSLYLLSTMTVANYNNNITVYEHIGSGAVLGALFRFNYGLKGMAAAACLGGFLGCFTGGFLVFYMWFNNRTLDDLRKLQHEQYYRGMKRNVFSA